MGKRRREESTKPGNEKQKPSVAAKDTDTDVDMSTSKSTSANVPFPRGGAGNDDPIEIASRHLELRSTRQQAELDFARGILGGKQPKSKKKKKERKEPRMSIDFLSMADDSDDSGRESDADGADAPLKVSRVLPLTHGRLYVGMKLLGVIQRVNEFNLVVSLPHNLSGTVPITEISPVFSEWIKKELEKDDDDDEEEEEEEEVPDLDTMFYPGQLVRCVIDSLESDPRTGRHTISLSLMPSKLQDHLKPAQIQTPGSTVVGYITSVEDHGVLLDLGLNRSMQCFVPNSSIEALKEHLSCNLGRPQLDDKEKEKEKEKAEDGEDSGKEPYLGRGALITCCIDDSDAKKEKGKKQKDKKQKEVRALIMKCDFETVYGTIAPMGSRHSFDEIVPGMLLEARIERVVRNGGVIVSVFGSEINGTIESSHFRIEGSEHSLEPGSIITTRVLFIDGRKKIVGLSALKGLVGGVIPTIPSQFKIGLKVEKVRVLRIDEGIGLVVAVPNANDDGKKKRKRKGKGKKEEEEDETSQHSFTLGSVHISRVADKHTDQLSKVFTVGSLVKARVMGFSHLDGVVILTMKKSIVDGSNVFLRYEDVCVGADVSVKVISATQAGVLCSLSPSVKGMIPPLHMGDALVSRPERRFPVDSNVKCRVLSVDLKSRKIYLTRKPTLLKSKLPIFTSYEECTASIGLQTHGVIIASREYGCIVSLYGNVKGLVPLSELSHGYIDNIEESFPAGTPVLCRILSCDSQERRLKMSLLAGSSSASASASATFNANVSTSTSDVIQLGAMHEGVVIGEMKGYIIVNIKVKAGDEEEEEEEDVRVHIADAHLSDHLDHCERLKNTVYTRGTKISKLMILEKENNGRIWATLKPSLVTVGRELPSTIEDLTLHSVVPGYIRNVTDIGCFVGFLGSLSGLAGRSSLADFLIIDQQPSTLFHKGQSVRAFISGIDVVRRRVTLSLQQSATLSADGGQAALSGWFSESDLLCSSSGPSGSKNAHASDPSLPVYKIGAVIDAKVKEVQSYGIVLRPLGYKQISIVVLNEHIQDQDVASTTVGTNVKVRVLDANPNDMIIDASMLTKYIDIAAGDATKKLKSKKSKAKGKGKDAKDTGDTEININEDIDAVIALIKPTYLVVSTPSTSYSHIIFVPIRDYNTRYAPKEIVAGGMKIGGKLKVRLSAPVSVADNRMIGIRADLKIETGTNVSGGDGKKGKLSALKNGQVVNATVKSIDETQVNVMLADGVKGRIHITECDAVENQNPFESFGIGDQVEARVVNIRKVNVGKNANTAGTGSDSDSDIDSDVERSPKKRSRTRSTAVTSIVELTMRVAGEGERGIVPLPTVRSLHYALKNMNVSDDPLEYWGYVQRAPDSSSEGEGDRGEWIWVTIGPAALGRIHVLDITTNVEDIERIMSNELYKPGDRICVRVLNADPIKNSIDMCVAGVEREANGSKIIRTGQVLAGKIANHINSSTYIGISIQLGPGVYGRVHICDLSDDRLDLAPKSVGDDPLATLYPVGEYVQCYVLGVSVASSNEYRERDRGRKQIDLSMRQSRLVSAMGSTSTSDSNVMSTYKPQVPEVVDVAVGDVVDGFIRQSSQSGVFVMLSRSLVGRIMLRELADTFTKDPSSLFPRGKSITARVIGVETGEHSQKIELSVRPGMISSTLPLYTWSDFVPGLVVRGSVKNIVEFGAFVSLDRTYPEVHALAHKTQIVDITPPPAPSASLKTGERVKGVIIKVDKEKKRVWVSLKPSMMKKSGDGDGDIEMVDSGADADAESVGEAVNVEQLDDEDVEMEGKEEEEEEEEEEKEEQSEDDSESDSESSESDSESESESSDEDEEEEEDAPQLTSLRSIGLVKEKVEEKEKAKEEDEDVDQDMIWSGLDDLEDDSTSTTQNTRSKSKSKAVSKMSEADVRAEEARLANPGMKPQSVDDFERLLIASPDSSLLWIEYLAFLVNIGDIESSRRVCERAIRTIHFREESERLNLWMAYLNLERQFGTQEKFDSVFSRAVQHNDSMTVHMRVAAAMVVSGNLEGAADMYKAATKKFKDQPTVWLKAGIFEIKERSDPEAAKALLQRALITTPKRYHIDLIAKFAVLEFRNGFPERGRTAFEGIVVHYPKRLDLWNVYLDQEIRLGDARLIRALFNRVTSLSHLNQKKMHHFFKRYLSWEKENGTSATVKRVMEKAKAYVSSK